MAREHKRWILRIVAATAAMALLSPTFAARGLAAERGREDERRQDPVGQWWRHGDIRRFSEADLRLWRSGRWVHGRHGGRLGWWWVVGGVWYLYPAPIYPYPNPYVPPVVVTPAAPPPQAPPQYWYYCNSAKAYYPYVRSCPEGWMQVVPQP
jgi:hypothetical protein